MKKLLVFLKDYKKESILGPLFKLLEASFELFVPLVIAAIIDVGIANKDIPFIIKMILLLILLGVIGLICSITAQYFAAKAATGFAAELKHALFSHIQSLSFTQLDTLGTNTLITRMTSDVNQVQTGVNIVLRLLLRSPFVVFGAMIMAFTIDVKSALLFAVTIPLLAVVIFLIMLVSIPLYKKVQRSLDQVLGKTRENLVGARVIRTFCKEEDEIDEFGKRNEELTHVQKFVGKISALLNPVTYIMINAAMIALIWVGAFRVEEGFITQGAVVALYNYMSQILVELIKFASLIITINKSLACANRIQGVLEMEKGSFISKSEHEKGNSEYFVEFKHVSLKYEGALEESLTDVNFKAAKGEMIGIIGGTGSGKSSLVNLIPGFYQATKGNVFIDGIEIRDYEKEKLQKKIGVVLQKAVLFQGSIRENMKWGKSDASDIEINQALETAQAKEIVDTKGEGLDYKIEQGGSNLSGGQKQRLTIARALVRKPEILILDDSASALDFTTEANLRNSISNMDTNLTVFIVSQRASSIRFADKIIVLEDGYVAGMGTHEELLASCEVYQEIYYSQFGGEGTINENK